MAMNSLYTHSFSCGSYYILVGYSIYIDGSTYNAVLGFLRIFFLFCSFILCLTSYFLLTSSLVKAHVDCNNKEVYTVA